MKGILFAIFLAVSGGGLLLVEIPKSLALAPPDTTIVSAVDGNGQVVPNGGLSLSNAITFTFLE